MIWLVAFLLAIPGFAGLCLSMKKSQRQIFDGPVSTLQSRLYRWTGAVLIALLSIWCMTATDWTFGLVILCGVSMIASLLIILMLALQPKALRYFCWVPSK
ncbi:MAG: DUF3325 domain-containing protein [Pseudomonadota bacterium]